MAALFAAMVLTLSCSGDGGGDPQQPSGGGGSSSSSGGPASSSSNGGGLAPCGAAAYNPGTQFCLNGNTPTSLCGGKAYEGYQFCSGNAVYDKCGGNTYNPANYVCCDNVQYDANAYGCCGNRRYSLAAQFCEGKEILDKCGGEEYDPATQFCSGGELMNVCGGKEYNPATHYCSVDEGKTYSCGGSPFNPAAQFCHTDGTIHSCDNKPYNPVTQFCHGNTIIDKCGNRTEDFDPNLYECRASINPNGIYLKAGIRDSRDGNEYNAVLIGTQIWMAENLNYNASGSRCYENKPENCDKYGRLYNWTTTICPSGWHVPNNDDWDKLKDAVGTSLTGTKLKATNEWNLVPGNGTDDYGFAALPGGRYSNYANIVSFENIGDEGEWWSASEMSNSTIMVYSRSMRYALSMVSMVPKTNSLSVRCVKD